MSGHFAQRGGDCNDGRYGSARGPLLDLVRAVSHAQIPDKGEHVRRRHEEKSDGSVGEAEILNGTGEKVGEVHGGCRRQLQTRRQGKRGAPYFIILC